MSYLDEVVAAKWYGPTNTPGPGSAEGLKTEAVERPAGYVPPYYQAMLDEERTKIVDTFDLETALECDSTSEPTPLRRFPVIAAM